jgi:hypothetical protein
MTGVEQEVRVLERVCCGDAEAASFLREWSSYVHRVDDLVDGDATGAEALLEAFAAACLLYSHPFYLRHLAALRGVALVIANVYADSVAWERSGVAWQREWADHNRHAGMEMVIAVAQICGGYAHARRLSLEQRVHCYVDHHDREGKME